MNHVHDQCYPSPYGMFDDKPGTVECVCVSRIITCISQAHQDDNLILVDTDRIISINSLMREILPAQSYMYSRNYFPLQAAKVYLCGTKFFKAT